MKFDYLTIYSKKTTITGTLHADRYTFFIISRSVLLRMRNVSDRSCTENQNNPNPLYELAQDIALYK